MATQKKNSGNKVKGGMGFGSNFRGDLGGIRNVADDKKRDDEDVPWSLIVVVLAVLLTFFIVMPIVGFMLWDLYVVKEAAIHEIRKMKELRKEILIERMYDK